MSCCEKDFNCSINICTGVRKSGKHYIYCRFVFFRDGEYINRELPAGKYNDCVKLYNAITARMIRLGDCRSCIEAL